MTFDWSSIIKPSGYTASSDRVEGFEASLGYDLPVEYKDFLLTHDGGKIVVDHSFYIPELSDDVFVSYLFPLSAPSPFLGIMECRDIQVKYRQGLKQAIIIGGDMGTGSFFMILDGSQRGAIRYAYEEDIPMRDKDWDSPMVVVPEALVKVSSSFSELGRMIAQNGVTH